MNRWVLVGGSVMMAAWVPFLYAEWTSRPVTSQPQSAVEEPSDLGPGPVTAGAPAPPNGMKAPASADSPAVGGVVPAAQPEHHAEAVSATARVPGDAGLVVAPSGPEVPTPSGPLEALKHAYETQPRDPLWASDTEAHLKHYFGANELPADMLHATSCRRAVCRLEVRWTSEHASAFVALNQRIAQDFGPEVALAPIATQDGDDVHRVDLYLIRKGFTVADLTK